MHRDDRERGENARTTEGSGDVPLSCLFSQLPNYQAASGQWGKFCVDANNGVVTTV
jgi:hypothetical protein